LPLQDLLVLAFGLTFFGLILVRLTRLALKTKETGYFIASIMSSLFVLAIILIFLGVGILAGGIMFLMIPLAVIGWWKRPPLDVVERNRIRPLDFLPFSTLRSWVRVATERGMKLAVFFFYMLITLLSAAILYAISFPFGLGIPDIIAFIIVGPIVFTYFFYSQLREKTEKPKPASN
jgi:hypothetical protein